MVTPFFMTKIIKLIKTNNNKYLKLIFNQKVF